MSGFPPVDEKRYDAISDRTPGRSKAPRQNDPVGSLAIPGYHLAERHTVLHGLRAQTLQICSLGRPGHDSGLLESLKPPWRLARSRLFRIRSYDLEVRVCTE